MLLIGVGIAALGFADFGLWYNAESFMAYRSGAFNDAATDVDVPYFDVAFLTLSGVCVVCFVALAWCGAQFLRRSLSPLWLFILVASVEILFVPVVGGLWLHPQYGRSIAAASGVSAGGLMPQVLVLFPLWAPVAVWFARKSLLRRDP
jgi:hypothetical protein